MERTTYTPPAGASDHPHEIPALFSRAQGAPIPRAALVEVIDQVVDAYSMPVEAAAALRRVARTSKRVALGAYEDHGVGCPLWQAGIFRGDGWVIDVGNLDGVVIDTAFRQRGIAAAGVHEIED